MAEKVFISYNHADANIVDMISRRLELEFGRNNIFYDAWSIQPGDSIIGKMNEGLESFSTFFFFLSPNSLASKMVSLEWQTALNRAVNKDLKFVAVRIADCNPPAILSDKQYIDLYGEGMDSAVEKMKCVIKSESTYKPLDDVQNLVAKVKVNDSKNITITIDASMYAESNPTFAFACTNAFDEFSACFTISDGIAMTGKDVLSITDGTELNAQTVQLQRPLKPGFPFVFKVSTTDIKQLKCVSVYILVDASKKMYKQIPLLQE